MRTDTHIKMNIKLNMNMTVITNMHINLKMDINAKMKMNGLLQMGMRCSRLSGYHDSQIKAAWGDEAPFDEGPEDLPSD
jgi:hypothetical protein